jgi:hypothetical protein
VENVKTEEEEDDDDEYGAGKQIEVREIIMQRK